LRKGSSRKESSYSNSYPKKEYKRDDSLSKDKPKETPKSVGKDVSTSQPHNRDIQCFKCLDRVHIASQCPNRRTMILRERGIAAKIMSLVGKKRKKIVRGHILVREN